MPYVEQQHVYGQITFPKNTFWFGGTPSEATNRELWRRIAFKYMECPSATSVCARFSTNPGDNDYQRPFYTCILGADNHQTAMLANPVFNGAVSDGGVITLERGQRMSTVTDGTSNTVMVAEQSGRFYHNNGAALPLPNEQPGNDGRVDNNRGFHMGTSHVGAPNGNNTMQGSNAAPANCTNTNCARCYNTTTVAGRGINATTKMLFADYGDLKCNRPLASQHPNGINALYADGHVAYLTNNTPLLTLKALVNRDDGEAVNLP
jgi:prepilin-type processing-associated H-X9-DG protein